MVLSLESIKGANTRYTEPVEAVTAPTDETLEMWDKMVAQPGILKRFFDWMMEENPDRQERKRLYGLAEKWGLTKKSDDNSRS